jgi:hypothetical protein
MRRFRPIELALLALLATGLPGCMFRMTHELPLTAQFHREFPPGARRQAFRESGMKNYFLAGIGPYSGFGTKDLVEHRFGERAAGHLTGVAIETRFDALDTLIWVVPGFFYGYYLWAPRHVQVEGFYVDAPEPVVRAVP